MTTTIYLDGVGYHWDHTIHELRPREGTVTTKIYLIGSLRNPEVPKIAERIRRAGFEVFDQWHGAGPHADDEFYAYCKSRGWKYAQALRSEFAKHVFEFDRRHIEDANVGVLVMPAGKSGHLELGVMLGQGKAGYILFDAEPDRLDQMHQFANGIFFDVEDLVAQLLRAHA